MIEFYVDGIEIGDNPIGRGAERCPNVSFCYRKARNDQKNGARRPRKIPKNIKIFTKRSSVGALGTSLIPKCTVLKPCMHVIEILRQKK